MLKYKSFSVYRLPPMVNPAENIAGIKKALFTNNYRSLLILKNF